MLARRQLARTARVLPVRPSMTSAFAPRLFTTSPPFNSASTPTPKLGRLERYSPRLHALAARTGTPLPSLVLSFLILHELTAIVPVVGLYYLLHALGAGASVIAWLASFSSDPDGEKGWGHVVNEWYDEGSRRVERVGHKYGILGFEKGGQGGSTAGSAVADAIGAYVLVKALFPLRIAVSIGAAPAFARFALNPIQRAWRRLRK